jgi:tetratricopeptide (TPR) repeat protein
MPTIMNMNSQVFVCTNKWCQEKGSDATMATFSFLTPSDVPVVGVKCLSKCNQGPNARILTSSGNFVEASSVRSVQSVVELLQTHLDLNVNYTSAEVLRLNYEGNAHLTNGNLDAAINCYNQAIELGDPEQEGVLLVMRGSALLQRAFTCRLRHKEVVEIAAEVIPTYDDIKVFLESMQILYLSVRYVAMRNYLLKVGDIFKSLDAAPGWVETKAKWPEASEGPVVSSGQDLLSRAVFLWSLHEYALVSALQDLLTATTVMPGFAQAWRRAGDALAELRQFQSAIEYYEVAMRLDTGLETQLTPIIEKTKLMKKLWESAAQKGVPAEKVLALLDD